MIDTNGTLHAIATTAEAASIGGVTGGTALCILKSLLETFECRLKSPVPSGISYADNQAVQWYDLEKKDSIIYINNLINEAFIPYAIGLSEGSSIEYFELGKWPYDDWNSYRAIVHQDEILTIIDSEGAYLSLVGVVLLASVLFLDYQYNTITPDSVSVKKVECFVAGELVQKSISCLWAYPYLPEGSNRDMFVVLLHDSTNQSTLIVVTYSYTYNGKTYESFFNIDYERISV